MRKKNIITIVVAVTAFIVVGALLYRYIFPPTKGTGIQVTIPHKVNPNFNQEELGVLKNDVVDYTVNINIRSLINSSKSQNANNTASGGN
jgi:hypothetical protein